MVKFTLGEVRDIIISMVVVSLAFAYFLRNDYDGNFLLLVPATFVSVVPGFVFHELAHKFMAIEYGFDAEYKMLLWGLFLTVITSSLGIILAAPGAVYIKGDSEISKEQNGKISVVGPLTNIILALLFIILIVIGLFTGFIVNPDTDYMDFLNTPAGYLFYIGVTGFFINSFMAAINMLPWGILDGMKVFKWNKIIWVTIATIAFIMAIIPLLIIWTPY